MHQALQGATFHVEHIIPSSQAGLTELDNLAWACPGCNALKGAHILLDPCQEAFANHVRLADEARLEGLTREGRHLITRRDLNAPERMAQRVRHLWLYRLLQAKTANAEERAVFLGFFGYPDDLPDLAKLRPPANSRPGGVADCAYRQKSAGRLPAVY